MLRSAGQRLAHEINPHRQRRACAFLVRPERSLLVEPDPGGRNEIRVEAGEPGVPAVVRRSGLAGDVLAAERAGTLARAAANHVTQKVRDDPGIRFRDGPRRDFIGYRRGQGPADIRGAHDARRVAARNDGRRVAYKV